MATVHSKDQLHLHAWLDTTQLALRLQNIRTLNSSTMFVLLFPGTKEKFISQPGQDL